MRCDLCRKKETTLVDKTVLNNGVVEFHFCEDCYKAIMRSGISPYVVMCEVEAKKGKECPACGTTMRDFASAFMFGCPECYRNMREIAVAAAEATQGKNAVHVGKRAGGVRSGR